MNFRRRSELEVLSQTLTNKPPTLPTLSVPLSDLTFRQLWQRVSELELLFFSSRRRHTRLQGDWSSDVCSSDLVGLPDRRADPRAAAGAVRTAGPGAAPGVVMGMANTFGARLIRARVAKGLSQSDLAASSGIAPAQISRYEADKNQPRLHIQIGRASCRERV